MIVSSSIGKKPHVAPYSGAIFEIVARSGIDNSLSPSPKNSTNLPTTPFFLSCSVIVRTKSVAVIPSLILPLISKPITSGTTIEIGWPSIAASASIPPTPQPSTDKPLIIVVWLSVPTTVSGYARSTFLLLIKVLEDHIVLARYSKFTWWHIPVPGGTTRKLSNDFCPHLRNSYRSIFLLYSRSTFVLCAEAEPNLSTITEWSITRSTGDKGLIFLGSPFFSFIAERIEARSTTAGTPVKSCIRTLAGLKLISFVIFFCFFHFWNSSISLFKTVLSSSCLIRFSRSTLIE